jgi:glycosyltransferase involved in cell wall biosynthesis
LRRAIESVVRQTYSNWVMAIVNDGGNAADVEFLVRRYESAAGGRIRVIHNPASLGMEGASKVGLDSIESDLLVFHDDDDSWAPEFLSVAVNELLRVRRKFPETEGVTTYAHLVRETVRGNLIEIESVEPFSGWAPRGFLSLDRMLAGNFIPPISFLFSRKAYRDVGSVYEVIPYLGDWDFLIRFLSRYDVYMIPQFLAFYHWRCGSEPGGLNNTVTAEVDQHLFYRQYLLNAWLRRDFASGRFGVGTYANLRAHLESLLKPQRQEAPPPPPPPPPPAPRESERAQETEPLPPGAEVLPVEAPPALPPQAILDYYWESASWRALRPLRSIVNRLLGAPPEVKPPVYGVEDAWLLARDLQETWSWQATAPLRWGQAVLRLLRRK